MHCGNVCCASSTAIQKQTWAWIPSFLLGEVITLRSAPPLALGIKFEREDRTWEAEALNYIPFKDNLDLFLLTRSVTAHLDNAHVRSHRNPFPPCHLGCNFMKGALRTTPPPLFAPGESEAMMGSWIYQDRQAFHSSVVKILPKPQLKSSSLTQTYPVGRDHHHFWFSFSTSSAAETDSGQ